jgi:NADPH-dependent 7-cyano-7-deazaguanine reductase QueF
MSFQPHYTAEEKWKRRIKYCLIRLCRPEYTKHEADVFRDYTDEKVIQICKREANPLAKW